MNEEQELLQDQPEDMLRAMSREELSKRQADAVRWARNVGLGNGLSEGLGPAPEREDYEQAKI
jgi:hypothetical protein